MKSRGYTLIEILVVVALIGIIATIAYPTYQGYIRSTYQAQALADLKSCSMSLERFYSNAFTYAGADTAGVCTMWSPSDGPSTNKKFTITMPTLTKTNYVIKATPNSSADGECVQLSADGTQASC